MGTETMEANAPQLETSSLKSTMLVSLRATLVTLIVTGLIYPFVMTGLGQLIFPKQAAGSLVHDGRGQVVGSTLIGQAFSAPGYFQTRPSAAGNGYDATSSSGSNLGGSSAKLRARVEADIARLRSENPDAPGLVPVELVTASASGLDPHISPAAARWQMPRVAKARGVNVERIQALVADATTGRDLGLWGESRVNVLMLNLALDKLLGAPNK
ncbi:MAG: K(+)-transporting ATPase subunit C [Deltaproteobacteria bacterium]|nr:K(+)-transporting ATPase subunit C [Deltaproteobacteria bacterium]